MKTRTLVTKSIDPVRNSPNRSSGSCPMRGFHLVIIAFASFALSPHARAVCEEGCDFVLSNTFLGNGALGNNTTGAGNTAVGDEALSSNTTGLDNTVIGTDALKFTTTGNYNTATGTAALEFNTTGGSNTATGAAVLSYNTTGNDNVGTGYFALIYNTTGNENTAIGSSALLNNETGSRNVANGFQALYSNVSGGDNTATGMNALFANTGNYNTATGYQALESNTTGSNNSAHGLNALNANTTGSSNTAEGANALFSNTTGSDNTASGWQALYFNTTGNNNTATGLDALLSNTTGLSNTANGVLALGFNTTGSLNTATGVSALGNNTIGANNTAIGGAALQDNTTGPNNTAVGFNALLSNTTGSGNIALGVSAGTNLTTGSNNIDIGNNGVAGDFAKIRIGTRPTHKNTFIAGIFGVTVPTGVAVLVDNSGHLGTTTSSARFKEAIRPMDKASEAILSLKPVTFRYKEELDPAGIPQFGLVAEEVEKVNPALVARDDEGKPYSVRYEAVNAMLLNEFLKEHRKVESLEAKGAQQESTNTELKEEIKTLKAALKEQATQIQKVSARGAADRPAPRLVVSDVLGAPAPRVPFSAFSQKTFVGHERADLQDASDGEERALSSAQKSSAILGLTWSGTPRQRAGYEQRSGTGGGGSTWELPSFSQTCGHQTSPGRKTLQ